MAINGLLNTDAERAIPMLEKLLQQPSSRKLQERALFVLTQSNSPRAREIVVRIAKGDAEPDLQRKAIQQLGVFGKGEPAVALGDLRGEPRPEREEGRAEGFPGVRRQGACPRGGAFGKRTLSCAGMPSRSWA